MVSAIFQLYSDGQDSCPVSKFWPAAGQPTPWAARGLKRSEPTPTWAPGCPKTSLTALPSEGSHAVKVCRESNPDRLIDSPALYLYATTPGVVRKSGILWMVKGQVFYNGWIGITPCLSWIIRVYRPYLFLEKWCERRQPFDLLILCP